MKRFLIIQVRPEDKAADNELEAFLKFGDLAPHEILRIQADREPLPSIDANNFAGIIVGGGPSNVSDRTKSDDMKRMLDDIFKLIKQVVEDDIPFLGACYGFGALLAQQGGNVSKARYSEEVGAVKIRLTKEGLTDPLLKGFPLSFKAFVGHKEAAQELPPGGILLAGSATCPIEMVRFKNNIYATQFHPELDTDGIILRINIYKHAGYFPPEDAERLIAKVRQEEVTVPVKILQNFIDRYR